MENALSWNTGLIFACALVASCHAAGYGEPCSTTGNINCDQNSHLVCKQNGSSTYTCDCDTNYVRNTATNSCDAEIGLNQQGCSASVSDSCSDAKATCSSSTGYCTCQDGYFDNNGATVGGTCTARIELGNPCTGTPSECADPAALCMNNKCTCGNEYYDNNGLEVGGTCMNINGLQVLAINFSSIQTTGFTVSWILPITTQYINSFIISWTPKTPNNGITEGGSQSVQSSASSVILTTGITPGKAYVVRVTSLNTETQQNNQRTVSLQTEQAAKPGQPRSAFMSTTDLDAIEYGITVRWSAPAAGFASMYNVRLLDEEAEKTANQSIQQTSTNLNFKDIRNGYRYNLEVQAKSEEFNVNSYTLGDWQRFQIKTTVQVPEPPTVLNCPNDTRKDQSIKLTWQAPANPNGDIVGYQVEKKDLNDQFEKSYNSTGTSVEYTVTGLSPGTGYRFYVYTLNEQYKSSNPAINGICETSAPLATPPRNLTVDNVESRLFSISWEKPEVINSAENFGYVISVQLENQACVREEVFKCSNCTKQVEDVYQVSGVCLTNNSTMKTISDLEGLQKYTISNLTPDTQYSVSVAAINYAGKGNTAEKTIWTKEEVPQKPKCSLSNILAKSVNVTWTIGEPRPGQTNYTVQTTGAYPAANRTGNATGFTNRSMEVNQLEEFWNYSIVVKAATSLGSNTSDPCTMQTLPTAPGIVDAFNIMTAPGGDYTRIKVQWKAPTELNRNSIIKGYNFTHNATDISESGTKFVEEVDISIVKERIVEVVPETTYNFEVVAVNVLDQYGAPTKQVIFAPPVPKDVNNAALIGGVVGGVGGALIVIAIVALILWRRKKALPAMKKSKEDNEENFENLASETAKIKRKRPIQLDGIAEYVDNMHKDSNLLFSSEYDDVKTLSAKHACEAAEREENRLKNRYINIIPFDHSRVKLTTNGEDESSDYINANYLPGYSSPREYIGCQGPIPGTIDDFWRMVWEQNAAVIVMLTLCKEGQKIKCEQYWPDEVGEPKQYGEVIVEITSYSNIRTYDYRMFKITMGNKSRVIKHFHFLSWLDFQANVHHDIILDFIKQVRQHVQPPDRSGPMVIHCSAGVGRTGTYICLDHLMQFVAEHDFNVDVDIFDMVLKLRENRMHMVQTEQQYVFIHDCLKEIVERKRNEDTYVNQGFCDDNIYQNEESLYQNVQNNQQKTEL